MKYSNSVEQYLAMHPQWKTELQTLVMLARATGMEETIKWGIPVYTFQGKIIVGIGAFKSYVGLWFYQGALLKDTEKKLINAPDGTTKALRQWRFNSIKEIENEDVIRYLMEALENQRQGNEIKPENKKMPDFPVELMEIFKQDNELKVKFEELSQFKQSEYLEYINDAKSDAAKLARIDKIIPLIMQGIGLNVKYRK